MWLKVKEVFDGVYMNQYFVDHPEMIMGRMKEGTNQYEKILDVALDKDQNLEEMLIEAIDKLPSNIYQSIVRDRKDQEQKMLAPNDIKNNTYAIINDKLYYRDNSVMDI